MNKFAHFLKDESGATAIEYALLAGLIGVGVAAAAGTFSSAIQTLADTVSDKLTGITFAD